MRDNTATGDGTASMPTRKATLVSARAAIAGLSVTSHRTMRKILLCSGLVVVGSSCDDAAEVVRPTPPTSVAAFVTAEAAANLDTDGRVILPGPLTQPYPQITESQARGFADAYRRIHLPHVIGVIERDRGGGIDVGKLRSCGRAYHVEPAIEPLPPNVLPAARRAYGPRWLITFCGSAGTPQVSVAVSAYATDLALENGRLIYPVEGGEFFFVAGIPIGQADGLPGQPESAIAWFAARTGIRISRVPHLVMLPRTWPQLAYWKLELERPAMLRSLRAGKTRSVSTVYFIDDSRWGHRGIWIADESAPLSHRFKSPMPVTRYGERPTSLTGEVRVRAGFALKLEPVEEK